MIESSSGFAVIDSSIGPSMLFFSHVAIFYQIVLPFLSKKDVWFYIHYIFKNTLMCFNNVFNTDRKKKMNE